MTHQGMRRCTSTLLPLNTPVQGAQYPQGARRSPTMAGAVATLRRTIKRPGIPPAAAAAAQQPTPNRLHSIVQIALQSKSRIQNMGNLLLWIRLARTGQMISYLLPFCNHRDFHFLFQIAHCLSFPVSCRDTPQKVPQTEKKPLSSGQRLFSGDPYGTRTHVTAVKGRCLNHLTNGPFW